MQKRGEKGCEDLRVISQNGEFDFPYEQIVIQRDENVVFARLVAVDKARNALGAYETPDKAEKAMEMLRKQYVKMEAQNVTSLSLNDALKRLEDTGCTEDEYDEVLKGIKSLFFFRFPQDSEVQI